MNSERTIIDKVKKQLRLPVKEYCCPKEQSKLLLIETEAKERQISHEATFSF